MDPAPCPSWLWRRLFWCPVLIEEQKTYLHLGAGAQGTSNNPCYSRAQHDIWIASNFQQACFLKHDFFVHCWFYYKFTCHNFYFLVRYILDSIFFSLFLIDFFLLQKYMGKLTYERFSAYIFHLMLNVLLKIESIT